MNTLELSFIYAYPLDKERRKLFEDKDLRYPPIKEVQEVVECWNALWIDTNEKFKIIELIIDLTERTPKRNLECFVFGAGLGAMSTPFLLPMWNKEGQKWSDEKFINIVIHELLHIFLSTDNAQYWKEARVKYADEEVVCINHILLYAMLYEIYQKLFMKEPLDFSRNNLPSGYARAIELVKEIGYTKIITEYKTVLTAQKYT